MIIAVFQDFGWLMIVKRMFRFTTWITCRVVAAQLNSRVSDLAATQATRATGQVNAQVLQEVPAQHSDVAKLQQKVVDLSVELRDVRREMGDQGKSSHVHTGAEMLQVYGVP